MAETALEKAKLKFEQARARLKALEARQSTEERKRDTRRKVILGGALLELAKTNKERRRPGRAADRRPEPRQ